ncbi:hypothetical protein ADIAG_04019 [Paeniglutamicibacter gangotriensis Lz1y]|uniref:Uncharacterized protein n=1 Tax=Paeniglutamicibacter gangotriensis Lz1y TaxID=1276920 RepID=M7NDW8_9MICC|nr:hypothetical protein ADIAG_04019 [Paeniglutamicibacter gangotriensis Lz1y]
MVMLRILIQAFSTFGAKPCTVFPAYRLERQRGHHCIPEYRLEINPIVDNLVLIELFVLRELMQALVVEKFLNIGFEVIRDGFQATAAFTVDINGCFSGY